MQHVRCGKLHGKMQRGITLGHVHVIQWFFVRGQKGKVKCRSAWFWGRRKYDEEWKRQRIDWERERESIYEEDIELGWACKNGAEIMVEATYIRKKWEIEMNVCNCLSNLLLWCTSCHPHGIIHISQPMHLCLYTLITLNTYNDIINIVLLANQ